MMAVIGLEIRDIPILISWLRLHVPQEEMKVNIHY